jgi:hypothetical protein
MKPQEMGWEYSGRAPGEPVQILDPERQFVSQGQKGPIGQKGRGWFG